MTDIYPASGFEIRQDATVDGVEIAGDLAGSMVSGKLIEAFRLRVMRRGRVKITGEQGKAFGAACTDRYTASRCRTVAPLGHRWALIKVNIGS